MSLAAVNSSAAAVTADSQPARVAATWAGIGHIALRDKPAAADQVHKLRSQILLAGATGAAEQLRVLEAALTEAWPDDDIAGLLADGAPF